MAQICYEQDLLLRNPSGAVSPKLVFGDADTYVYESADDVLDLYVAGSIHTKINASGIDHYLTIKSDHIGEHTTAHGTVIDNELSIVGTDKQAGFFYAGTTPPTNTTRLNYDGYFYATRLYTAGEIYSDGAATDVGLSIYTKGAGNMGLSAPTISLTATTNINLHSPLVICGMQTDMTFQAMTGIGGHTKGYNITIQGGTGYGTGITDGGDVKIYGGNPNSTGVRGNIYFGTGGAGSLPAKGSETNLIYYDTGTGKLSYGAAPTGGSGDVVAVNYTQYDLGVWDATAKNLTDTTGLLVWRNSRLGLGTADPQRLFHLQGNNAGSTTFVAYDDINTTDGNGPVISFRTTTTGVGGAAFQEMCGYQAVYVTHNHPTRRGDFQIFAGNSGSWYDWYFRGTGETYLPGDLTFNNGAQRYVKVNNAAASTAGDNLWLQGGAATTSGYGGGSLWLKGGDGVGTSTSGSVYIYGGTVSTAGNVLLAWNGSTAYGFVGIRVAASTSYSLKVAGEVYSDDDFRGANFILNSDIRLKTNIVALKPEYLDIDYSSFEFKSKLGQLRYGVIAQQVQEKYPELVREKDGELAVAYTDLMIREIAYLKDKVKELEGRMN